MCFFIVEKYLEIVNMSGDSFTQRDNTINGHIAKGKGDVAAVAFAFPLAEDNVKQCFPIMEGGEGELILHSDHVDSHHNALEHHAFAMSDASGAEKGRLLGDSAVPPCWSSFSRIACRLSLGEQRLGLPVEFLWVHRLRLFFFIGRGRIETLK